jgi:hypothetical protein
VSPAGLSHGVASESSDGSAKRAGLGALGHSERSLAPGEPRIVPLVSPKSKYESMRPESSITPISN